jgi:UDP-N-acetyl-D-mannosaminuronic acid transferase (WecB/TagA/CpsF family)
MKLIVLSLISIFSLIGYVNVGADTESPIKKEDKEFQQLMTDFNKTLEHNKKVQVQADDAKEKLIVATTNKIIKLSNENKELKTQLNEAKAILDSMSIDTGSSFSLLPIPKG